MHTDHVLATVRTAPVAGTTRPPVAARVPTHPAADARATDHRSTRRILTALAEPLSPIEE